MAQRTHEDRDAYRVPATIGEAEYREKGSRFLAHVAPVASVEEAADAVGACRKRHHDATHHVWAYRVGEDGGKHHSSDDGEPSGSAGRPVARQIERVGLTFVVVVVTRWYGGTKLGTGGLARAYGRAAGEALDIVPKRLRVQTVGGVLVVDYADVGAAERYVEACNGRVERRSFAARVRLTVAVPRSRAAAFFGGFAEALSGRGTAARVHPDSGAQGEI